MTVYRRRAECGLLEEHRDALSDAELDTLITDLGRDLSYSAQTVILEHLAKRRPPYNSFTNLRQY